MKKQLVGALVGGLVLFIWQFISFGLANLHQSQMQYTPQQDEILTALNGLDLAEGSYFVPNVPPDAPAADHQKLMAPHEGKPWAIVHYRHAMSMDMSSNMIRGFVIDFLAALFLCYILMGTHNLTMQRSIFTSVAIGLIGWLTISYLNSAWFKTNSLPDLIDAIVPFAIIGAFLGWWLNRD